MNLDNKEKIKIARSHYMKQYRQTEAGREAVRKAQDKWLLKKFEEMNKK